ncbi:MAG: GNAT family N-acetyltransferase [Solirubrobacteraceae bacterium]
MIAPPAPHPPLRDAAIVLRRYTEADVDELTAALQDPEIAEWTNVPAPYTRDHALRFIAEGPPGFSELALGICDAGDGRLLGSVGVRLDEVQRCAEMGYWVAADERGRGVATRAIRLVSRWAIGELGVGRVQILAAPDNAASRRAAEQAGFTAEGTLRAYRVQKDRRVDLVMHSLLPGEEA